MFVNWKDIKTHRVRALGAYLIFSECRLIRLEGLWRMYSTSETTRVTKYQDSVCATKAVESGAGYHYVITADTKIAPSYTRALSIDDG
jgi:hypothetical protein